MPRVVGVSHWLHAFDDGPEAALALAQRVRQ